MRPYKTYNLTTLNFWLKKENYNPSFRHQRHDDDDAIDRRKPGLYTFNLFFSQ